MATATVHFRGGTPDFTMHTPHGSLTFIGGVATIDYDPKAEDMAVDAADTGDRARQLDERAQALRPKRLMEHFRARGYRVVTDGKLVSTMAAPISESADQPQRPFEEPAVARLAAEGTVGTVDVAPEEVDKRRKATSTRAKAGSTS